MARNRKAESAAIRFGPALKAVVLCLFMGGLGVGYVWQKSQLNELGVQIVKKERRLAELEMQNKKYQAMLDDMQGVKALTKRIQDMKLGLILPAPSQIWRLPEPSSEAQPVGLAEKQFASRARISLEPQL